jgi:hypothetical protein
MSSPDVAHNLITQFLENTTSPGTYQQSHFSTFNNPSSSSSPSPINNNNSNNSGKLNLAKSPFQFEDIAADLEKVNNLHQSFSVPSSLSGLRNTCFCQCKNY